MSRIAQPVERAERSSLVRPAVAPTQDRKAPWIQASMVSGSCRAGLQDVQPACGDHFRRGQGECDDLPGSPYVHCAMGAVLLGVVIAACFGSGDFVGGVASGRASTPGVLLVSQTASAVGALALAFAVHGSPELTDLVLGAAAGASNVIGLALLYGALARHSAGVVAPVAAMVGAAVPVAWGFARGERPSALIIVGVCAAVAAGGLISLGPSGGKTVGHMAAGTMRAIAAGLGLGVSLVLFDQTGHRSGQWPVLAARIAAAAGAAAVCTLLARRSSVRVPRGGIGVLACSAGALDVAATALLVVAVRRELLVVVAPLASLGPAFTVLWAWRTQGERLHRSQVAGLGCALVGLALMSSG